MALDVVAATLFTNLMALFVTQSDFGVQTIIGSNIFNLLLILGISILASPIQPLVVDKWPFFRDCFFYLLSVGLLYWVLRDGVVTLREALVLLTFTGFFFCAVGYTDRVLVYFGVREINGGFSALSSREEEEVKDAASEDLEWSSDCPFVPMDEQATISVSQTSRMECRTTATSHKLEIHDSHFVAEGLWERNFATSSGGGGLCNKQSRSSNVIGTSGLSCAVEMTSAKGNSLCSASGRGQKGAAPASTLHALSPMGLASPLLTSGEDDMSDGSTTAHDSCNDEAVIGVTSESKAFSSTTTPRSAKQQQQQSKKLYFRDILGTTQLEGPTQISFRDKSDDTIRYFITFSSEAVLGQVLDLMDKQARDKKSQQRMSSPKFSVTGNISQICSPGVRNCQKAYLVAALPINFLFESTMRWCDPKNPKTESLWLVAFTISMCWLAVFSYILVTVADIINIQFHITQAILGVTLCAAGTSFPNLWASYITAKEGKTSMAVANALGSNVQNVFIALALPWVGKTLVSENHEIPMVTPGIMDGVAWMGGTWLLLVLLAVGNDYALQPWMGYLFLKLYLVYLVDACFIHTS
ncbi:unnamed protein product [Amoebophrya sp. A120]|nr:unnamed protein product [Amoebophrya sp. A120]|eukprot:GSA120T00019405001.1